MVQSPDTSKDRTAQRCPEFALHCDVYKFLQLIPQQKPGWIVKGIAPAKQPRSLVFTNKAQSKLHLNTTYTTVFSKDWNSLIY